MKIAELIYQYEKEILSHNCNIEYLERRLANLPDDHSEEIHAGLMQGIRNNRHSISIFTEVINDLKKVTQ